MACDKIEKFTKDIDNLVSKLIKRDIPNFDNLPNSNKYKIIEQIKNYIKNKRFTSKSFDAYGLQGTPSNLVIDKNGILRHKLFGAGHGIKKYTQILLDE